MTHPITRSLVFGSFLGLSFLGMACVLHEGEFATEMAPELFSALTLIPICIAVWLVEPPRRDRDNHHEKN